MFCAERALLCLAAVKKEAPVEKSMLAEINRLRKMSVAQLRDEWFRLYGEPTNSRNRDYLWRRLAWRVQELAHRGLGDCARARIAELVPDAFIRARTPREFQPPVETPAAATTATRTPRDSRLPSPGTVISRQWHGRELRLVVVEDGYELDGQHFDSLSEAARHVTGAHWNGKLFWAIVQRKRKA